MEEAPPVLEAALEDAPPVLEAALEDAPAELDAARLEDTSPLELAAPEDEDEDVDEDVSSPPLLLVQPASANQHPRDTAVSLFMDALSLWFVKARRPIAHEGPQQDLH